MVQVVATIQIPGESQLSATITMTIADWTQMRDDINGLITKSVPLAQLALQLDTIIQRARAQIGE